MLADHLVAAWYSPRLTALAVLLLPLSLLFRLGVALRRIGYRIGVLRTVRLSVPVVVVGNITVGGSGKTPLVAALAAALAQRGHHPGIVSRGYGRDNEDGEPLPVGPDDDPRRVGDEPLLLARAGYPVVVARDRVAAARALIARQSGVRRDPVRRRLAALSAGEEGRDRRRRRRARVRQSIDVAGRPVARTSVATRRGRCCRDPRDGVGSGSAVTCERAFTMRLVGDRFVRVDDPLTSAPASLFARRGVHALAGIGHPARFFAQLAAMGIAATPHPFRDHHRFVAGDLAIADANAILMTEKDALKCETFADERCWYLPVQAQIDDALITLVEGKLRGFKAA